MADPILDIEIHAVRDVIERYFHAVDAKDIAALGLAFSDDAEIEYFHSTPDSVVMKGWAETMRMLTITMARLQSSCHAIANFVATVEGVSARADTFAISYVVIEGHVHVRGLRYQDQLKRRADGAWCIRRRIHTPLWQFDAAATVAAGI